MRNQKGILKTTLFKCLFSGTILVIGYMLLMAKHEASSISHDLNIIITELDSMQKTLPGPIHTAYKSPNYQLEIYKKSDSFYINLFPVSKLVCKEVFKIFNTSDLVSLCNLHGKECLSFCTNPSFLLFFYNPSHTESLYTKSSCPINASLIGSGPATNQESCYCIDSNYIFDSNLNKCVLANPESLENVSEHLAHTLHHLKDLPGEQSKDALFTVIKELRNKLGDILYE